MEQAVVAFDLRRMLVGDESPLFLLEIAARTLIIYLYTLALMRWLGSRALSQLSTVEFLLVIALGSAVGDAMFYPDVPLLHGMLVVTVVVVVNKGLDMLIANSKVAERVIDDIPSEAIRDGVICPAFLTAQPLSRSELFQQLRKNGIAQLGEVQHAYIEPGGMLTVFRYKEQVKPGLPIVPPPEIEEPELVTSSPPGSSLVCAECGNPSGELGECGNCGEHRWTRAAEPAS